MLEALGLTILFVIGFVVFGVVAGYLVGRVLAPRFLPADLVGDPARQAVLVGKAATLAAWTSGIVCGMIGVMAMLFDGPGAALWQ